ncbi:MAG TPA: FAD-dependent oxidoreductase [Myxococcota bacterium]|nr:FAD-dependent oxidoreductase [Myxococcota bacterium]
MQPRRAVVIGAGLAGLEAALRLQRAGIGVLVIERDPHPGGRAAGSLLHGFRFTPGAHAFRLADRRLRERLASLGFGREIELLPAGAEGQLLRDRVSAIHPTRLRGLARIPGAGLGGLRLPRIRRLLARYARVLDGEAPERAAGIDDRSALEFGRLYFGRRLAERWIEATLAEVTLGDASETSRVLFLLRHGLGAGAQRVVLRSGVGALVEAMAKGMTLQLGVDAVTLERSAAGSLRIVAAGASSPSFDADAVVCATPPAEAARIANPLLSYAERAFFAESRAVASVVLSVALASERILAPRRVRIPPVEALPLSHVVIEAGSKGGAIPAGNAIVTLIARDAWSRPHLAAPAEVVEKELLVHGERIVPALAHTPLFTQLARWEYAYPRFDVGRFRAISRFQAIQEQARRDGRRLYFAGDYLVGPSMESALVSGARVAEAVLTDLGVRPPRAERP